LRVVVLQQVMTDGLTEYNEFVLNWSPACRLCDHALLISVMDTTTTLVLLLLLLRDVNETRMLREQERERDQSNFRGRERDQHYENETSETE